MPRSRWTMVYANAHAFERWFVAVRRGTSYNLQSTVNIETHSATAVQYRCRASSVHHSPAVGILTASCVERYRTALRTRYTVLRRPSGPSRYAVRQ